MQHDDEVVVLYLIDDILHIGRRERLAIVVRQETGGGFSHQDTIHARQFQRLTIFLDKLRTLCQQRVGGIGILVNQHHDARHVVKSTSQRERTDTSGKDGAVLNGSGCQQIRLEILRNTACLERWHLQVVDALHVCQHMAHDGWHRLVAKCYLSAKSLCLGGQVHNGTCCHAPVVLRQFDDGICMHLSVAHRLAHRVAVLLDSRVRHHGNCCHFFLVDDVSHPLLHVYFHLFL